MKPKKKTAGVKFSVMAKIMLIALLPLLLLFVVSSVCLTLYLDSMYESQTTNLLETTVSAVESAYDSAYAGDYALKGEDLYKGDKKLSGEFDIVDTVKEETGVVITIFYDDMRMVTSVKDSEGNRATGTQADPKIYATVQSKGSYAGDAVIGGSKYSVYYRALKNSDGKFAGMFFAGYSKADMEKYMKGDIRAKIMKTMLYLGGVFLLCVIVIIPLTLSIVRSLVLLDKSVVEIAKGDFTVAIDKKVLRRNDEIGLIGRSVETMKEDIKRIVLGIFDIVASTKTSAKQVSDMAENANKMIDDVSHAVDEIAIGATSQAEDTQSAVCNVETMGKLIEEVVENVKTLTGTANGMGTAEKNAMSILGRLDETTIRTSEAVKLIADQTEATNQSAKEILQVIDLITSIADQTNLLSLNASIEAARAGESGRGFAVVASEIQILADQSNESAGKIKQIVSGLLSESAKTVDYMQRVEEAVAKQVEELDNTKEIFAAVGSGVNQSLDNISDIHGYTGRLHTERTNIVEAIQNLSAVSEENAAATQETTASTAELTTMMNELSVSAAALEQLADKLEDSVKVFKVQ